MYDVGELSMIMVSLRSRPICDRSCKCYFELGDHYKGSSYLHVVTLVVVTTFAEKPVMYNAVDIQLIQQWITVLRALDMIVSRDRTTTYLGHGGGKNYNLI